MAELEYSIDNTATNTALKHAAGLLRHYSFDLGSQSAQVLLEAWLETYPADWIRLAVVEALYQGRYKAISVDQILRIWRRRQQPTPHFSYEFERLVGDRFPRDLLGAQRNKQQSGQPSQIMSPVVSSVTSQPTSPALSQNGQPKQRLRPDATTWMEMARQAYEESGESVGGDDRLVSQVAFPIEPVLSPDLTEASPAVQSAESPLPVANPEVTRPVPSPVTLVQEIIATIDDPWESELQPTLIPAATVIASDSSVPDSPILRKDSMMLDSRTAPEAPETSQHSEDRSSLLLSRQTIHQFQPEDADPEFCNKLKAVAEQALEPPSPDP